MDTEVVLILLVWAALVALYIVAVIYIARYAESKGHSYLLFGLLALLVSPLLSALIIWLLPDKTQTQTSEASADSEQNL